MKINFLVLFSFLFYALQGQTAKNDTLYIAYSDTLNFHNYLRIDYTSNHSYISSFIIKYVLSEMNIEDFEVEFDSEMRQLNDLSNLELEVIAGDRKHICLQDFVEFYSNETPIKYYYCKS